MDPEHRNGFNGMGAVLRCLFQILTSTCNFDLIISEMPVILTILFSFQFSCFVIILARLLFY